MLSCVSLHHCCNSSQCSEGRIALLGHDVEWWECDIALFNLLPTESSFPFATRRIAAWALLVLCGLHSVLNSESRIRVVGNHQHCKSEKCQFDVMQASISLQNENLMFLESLLQRNSLWLSYEWWVLKNNVCATYLCGNFRKCIRRGKQPAARIMVKAKLKVELTQYK